MWTRSSVGEANVQQWLDRVGNVACLSFRSRCISLCGGSAGEMGVGGTPMGIWASMKKRLLSPLQAGIASVLIVTGPDSSGSVMGPLGQSRRLDPETPFLASPFTWPLLPSPPETGSRLQTDPSPSSLPNAVPSSPPAASWGGVLLEGEFLSYARKRTRYAQCESRRVPLRREGLIRLSQDQADEKIFGSGVLLRHFY